MASPTISINIGAKIDEATRAIKDFERSFKTSFANIAGAIDIAEKGFKLLNKGFKESWRLLEEYTDSAKAVEFAIKKQNKEIGESLDKNEKFQQVMGSVIEAYKEFAKYLKSPDFASATEAVAKFFGTMLEDIGGAIQKFNDLKAAIIVAFNEKLFGEDFEKVFNQKPSDLKDKVAQSGLADSLNRAGNALSTPDQKSLDALSGAKLAMNREAMLKSAEEEKRWHQKLDSIITGAMLKIEEAEARNKEIDELRRIQEREAKEQWNKTLDEPNRIKKDMELEEQWAQMEEKLYGPLEAAKAFKEQMQGILESGVTDVFVTLGESIANGFGSITQALGQIFGGMIKQVGIMLIQLGTAAVAAGILGTAVPILAPVTGGPMGIGAGIAAIAVGTGLVAVGSLMGGRGGNAGASARIPSRGAGSGRKTSAPQMKDYAGQSSLGSVGNGPTVINVNFGRGFVVGSKQEVARAINDTLNHASVRGAG